MTRSLPLLLLISLALACAQLKNSKTVCPQYRDLRCATAPECSMDHGNGCLVCQCAPAGADVFGTLPSGIAPDRR